MKFLIDFTLQQFLTLNVTQKVKISFRKLKIKKKFPKFGAEYYMFMKKILLSFLVLFVFTAKSQEKFTISGYIKDSKNGESLIGVTVYKKGSQMGTSTNEYGFYSLTLPKGLDTIVFSFVGYKTIQNPINLLANQTLSMELGEEGKNLEEVIISSDREDQNITSMEMSVAKLDIKQIQKMPALLGEVDVIKSIQLLPGVTTVGEGASGFNVRGGNIDQNLVLMDEAPVYNASHLFGFFSIFNPDAVKDVKLLKYINSILIMPFQNTL